MPFQRDPLSVQYDAPAARIISQAIERAGTPLPWRRGAVDSGSHERRESTGARLTATERALQRALYHDQRIHKARKNTGGPWSLKIEWDPVVPGQRRRTFRIRVFSDTVGARKVRRDYRSQSYVKNPALRSRYAITGEP